jgi:cobalt-zinc-cadmium resistance protein CzcA
VTKWRLRACQDCAAFCSGSEPGGESRTARCVCIVAALVRGVGALLLIGAGIVFLPKLPIDAFPDVSPVQVKVIMKAPGLTPEEVEQRITVPIELELLGIPNKNILRSVSKYALADITLDFEDGTDIYLARNQVSERLSSISRDLPDGVSGGLAPITSPLGEMFMFTIESPELSLAERRTLLDWVIRPALRTVPGVAHVNTLGGHVRAFEIVPDSAALAARGIYLDHLRRAIETNSRKDGAGRVNRGEDSALVSASKAASEPSTIYER